MELNTHACLLRGMSGELTANKRLDLKVYKLEEAKSNWEAKKKLFNKIKGHVCCMFLLKINKNQQTMTGGT